MTSKTKMVLTFAEPIKQVANNQVEVSLEQGPPIFSQDFIESLHKLLGIIEGEKYLAEQENAVNLRLITSGITSRLERPRVEEVEVSPLNYGKK